MYTNEIVFWDSDEGRSLSVSIHIYIIPPLRHYHTLLSHPLLHFVITLSYTGKIVKRIEAEDLGRTEAAVDITAAVLDDRERKVVTGDSSGVVSVYNCATAVKIKSFPPLPTSGLFLCSIRHIINQ